MTPSIAYGIILLNCNHHLTFNTAYMPKVNDRLYCPRCQKYERVTERVGAYKALCAVVGCRYSRNYGAGKLTAQRAADRHCRTYPGHVVGVWLGKERISVHGELPNQLLMPVLDTL